MFFGSAFNRMAAKVRDAASFLQAEFWTTLMRLAHNFRVARDAGVTAQSETRAQGGTEDWMFPSPVKIGRLPYSYTGYWRALQDGAKAAGIGRRTP